MEIKKLSNQTKINLEVSKILKENILEVQNFWKEKIHGTTKFKIFEKILNMSKYFEIKLISFYSVLEFPEILAS